MEGIPYDYMSPSWKKYEETTLYGVNSDPLPKFFLKIKESHFLKGMVNLDGEFGLSLPPTF